MSRDDLLKELEFIFGSPAEFVEALGLDFDELLECLLPDYAEDIKDLVVYNHFGNDILRN